MVRIFKRKIKQGKSASWYGDWTDLHGKRVIRRLSEDKRRAGRMLAAIVADVERGTYIDPRGQMKDIKLHDLIEKYLKWAEAHCSEATLTSKDYVLRGLESGIGNVSLRSIGLADLEAHRDGLLKRIKRGSAATHIQIIKHLFSQAVRWKYLHASPAADIPRPRMSDPIVRFLRLDEIDRLLDCCKRGMLKDAVALSLNTGLRRSELFALRRGDCDFHVGMIAVIGKGGKPAHIPMNATSREILKRLCARVGTDLLFVKRSGKPFERMTGAFNTALTKAGISNFRWHDLRHTFASQLVIAGVDLNRVRELMRHSSYQMTLRYAHLAPHDLVDAVKLLDRK